MKFLQTYAKRKTRLSAWISNDDRKRVFDSSASASASDADVSRKYASKPTRIRNTRNAAKKKAPLQLTSEDEDDVFTRPQFLPQKRRTTARKPSTACVLPTRKRKLPSLSVSSDEENVVPPTRNTRRKNSTAHSGKYTRHKSQDHCNDENMCPSAHDSGLDQNSDSQAKSIVTKARDSVLREQTAHKNKPSHKDSFVRAPSAGRFVTRRKCVMSPRPLNSSDEFSISRICRPTRRRAPQPLLESSADSSASAAVLRSFVTIPLRDISLNDSGEHSLGPCTRKPIFCSTPSAALSCRTSKHKSLNPSASPPCISLSRVGPDFGSSEQLASPPPALPSAPSFEIQAALEELQKLSQSLIKDLPDVPHDKTSSSGKAHSLSRELPSALSISSDLSSCFASASAELDWLTDVLKEKCLTELCTVRLERVEELIRLFSETTYSSCFGDFGSVCGSSVKEPSVSVDGSHTSLSKDSPEPSVCPELSKLSVSAKSSEQDDLLVGDSASADSSKPHSSSLDLIHGSAKTCTDKANIQVQDGIEEHSMIIQNQCLSRECSVNLKKLPRSSIEKHLTPESRECSVNLKRLPRSSIEKHLTPESRECSVNLKKLPRSSIEKHLTPELNKREASPSVARLSPTKSPIETRDEAEVMKGLKEKCLNSEPRVKTRRMTVTEIKALLQESMELSNRSVSELVCEPTESERNGSVSSPKETCYGERRLRKRTSVTSNDEAVSDEHVSETSRNRQRKKNKKKSLPPKEKRLKTSTQQPGTNRKACVSGLSVSRWKNKNTFTSMAEQRKGAVDCSISELIPNQHRQPVAGLSDFSKNFSTPVKGNNLNLSSLLAEFTPSTQTWSRLKAALSIHRKVILTPKTPGPSSRIPFTDLSQDLFATPFRTPLPKRLRSQLRTHESQLVFDDDELSDAEKVFAECGQRCPLPWDECLLPQRMNACVKIGEGTFGEVFSTISEAADEEIVALKVIPVEGSEKVNGEAQKTFGEILHEIIISKELSCLKDKEENQTSGFIGLKNLHCVKGCYPPDFLNAWDKFNKEKHSENDRPDFFEKEQLFIILEFEFGGSDLENCNGTLPTIIVAKSILHQVTAALAVAEQELQFEHRDLHWGNVLVKSTQEETTDFSLNGTMFSLETKGVHVRIIDYSLSRLEIDDLTVSCDISQDEELFMGQGDYQFDIYRQMRQENGNDWSSYNPHSNVLWIHYLCSKLLNMKYSRSRCKGYKDMRGKLSSFYDNVLQHRSATEVLHNSLLFQ